MARILFHILNLLFLVAFALSVAVQYNDPDPFLWMLMYGFAALCCVLFFLGRLSRWVATAAAVAALFWSGLLLPSVVSGTGELSWQAVFSTVEMKNERVELVREIGGLWIVAGWMFILALVVRNK